MIENYFKVALRNILKHKFYSAINILGMTIGITSCLLISLYIYDELRFDTFHKNAERIYHVGLHGKLGGQDIRTATTCPPMAAALVAEVPEVEAATRLIPLFGRPAFKYADKIFTEERIFYADSNFFQFFSFVLKEGDSKAVLREPNTVVLTEALATKYFGNEPAIGKLLVIGRENKTFTVTGIAATPPSNSSIRFNALISTASDADLKNAIWLNNYMQNYFLLRENAAPQALEAKFESIVEKYVGPEIERFMGSSLQQMKASGGEYGYYITKLTDIHLHSTSQGDLEPSGNIMYVYFFGGIGTFIILIACINFMNLSTARSAGRAKEVGLRKTLGSMRSQMIGQFLSESVIYSAIGVVLSFAAAYFLLPSFNLMAGKEMQPELFFNPLFILILAGLIFLIGLMAGSYPAFYLTSFNPVEVLKGKVKAGAKSKGFRSFLVVFQFALSIFLIIFTAVVYQQISFMQNKNLGIDKNNVLILQSTNRLGNNKEAFRNILAQQKEILKSSYTNNTFPGVNNTTVFRQAGSEQDHIMGLYFADYDHMDVMKFELKDGRYFSRDFASDSTALILNEAAVREFGLENPIGEEIQYNDNGRMERLKVIGIVKNFNFESFKDQVRPLSVRLTANANNLLIRYEGSSAELVSKIEKLWKEYAANEPFEYTFLDQDFDELFRSELRMGQIFTLFSALAIFIASLGLFALAAFTSEQRTKEIGIRKSMGATVFSLTVLLSREFTKLVLIAFIPACAIGWYVSDVWLQGFAYRVEVHPIIYIGSGLLAILIAWLTVSYQSIKTAMANPVSSLRYE